MLFCWGMNLSLAGSPDRSLTPLRVYGFNLSFPDGMVSVFDTLSFSCTCSLKQYNCLASKQPSGLTSVRVIRKPGQPQEAGHLRGAFQSGTGHC